MRKPRKLTAKQLADEFESNLTRQVLSQKVKEYLDKGGKIKQLGQANYTETKTNPCGYEPELRITL